jgi:hypothetical protein
MPTADAANQYLAYQKGWSAGAAMRAMDGLITSHHDLKIAAAYDQGYSDGRLARSKAMQAAADRYKHQVNILRLCDGDGAAAEA